jgi:flagellar hook protein FlgE
VDSNGEISTDPSDLSRLRSINIGSVGGTAEPTTRVQINANLRSSQESSSAASAQSYKGVSDTATPAVTHDVSVRYTRTGANSHDLVIKSGSQKIDASATFDPTTGAITGLTINGANAGSATAIGTPPTQIQFTPASGPAYTINLSDVGLGNENVAKTKYDPSVNSMAMYNADDDNPVGVKPDFKMNIPVSDSKGGQRNLELRFLKSDEPNIWFAEIVSVPASDVIAGAPYANGQIKTGKIAFTPSGRLDVDTMKAWPAGTGLFDDPTMATLNFGKSDPANLTMPAGEVAWADGLGIAAQAVTLDLNTSAGGLSQLNTASVVQSTVTNGTAFGNLSEIKIDEGGFVTAIFDNGVMRRIAQVAVATFPSPDSLREVSGNAYAVSLQSGTFNLKAAGTGGAGEIAAKQLESSTVDLSAEFTGLITTQRAYSASSKIITTADEMLAELINIKR